MHIQYNKSVYSFYNRGFGYSWYARSMLGHFLWTACQQISTSLCTTCTLTVVLHQWRSQDIADARAQHILPIFCTRYRSIWKVWGMLSQHKVSVQDSDTALFDFRLALNSWSTMILSAPIIHMRTCSGGARSLVARACAPCSVPQPGYATVLHFNTKCDG